MAETNDHQDFDLDHAFKDYAREPVPEHALRPSWRLFAIWLAAAISLPYMMTGVVFGKSLSLPHALLAIIIGLGFVAILISIAGIIGVRTRLPVSMLTPNTFGIFGSKILAMCIALSLVGWFGFQVEIFAQALQLLIKTHFDIHITQTPLKLFGGTLMITSAIIGFRAIDALSQIAIPLMFVCLLFPFCQLLFNGGLENFKDYQATGDLTFGGAIDMLIAAVSLGLVVTPDMTRYIRSASGTVAAIMGSQLFGTGGAVLFAFFLVRATGGSELIPMLAGLGWALPILFFILLGTWTTNDTNVYFASTSLAGVMRNLIKWRIAAICGLLGIVFSLIGVKANFVPFLSLLGIVFGPAGAVFIIDYFRRPARYKDAHAREAPAVRIFPCIAWLAGIMLGWLTTPAESLGLGLFTLTGTPALDGIIMAGIVYLFLQFAGKTLDSRRPSRL
jgi:cytosine permease